MCLKDSGETFSVERAFYQFHFQLMLSEKIRIYQDFVILMDMLQYFCRKQQNKMIRLKGLRKLYHLEFQLQ